MLKQQCTELSFLDQHHFPIRILSLPWLCSASDPDSFVRPFWQLRQGEGRRYPCCCQSIRSRLYKEHWFAVQVKGLIQRLQFRLHQKQLKTLIEMSKVTDNPVGEVIKWWMRVKFSGSIPLVNVQLGASFKRTMLKMGQKLDILKKQSFLRRSLFHGPS